MPWLKTVGCDCPECGPDPCSPGCVCEFSTGEVFGNGSVSDVYDVTGEFYADTEIDIGWSLGPGGYPNFARLQIFADSVEIYDSGCIDAGVGGYVQATVPAGTVELEMTVTAACAGGSPYELGWTYEISC